jgi:hypothetical protein
VTAPSEQRRSRVRDRHRRTFGMAFPHTTWLRPLPPQWTSRLTSWALVQDRLASRRSRRENVETHPKGASTSIGYSRADETKPTETGGLPIGFFWGLTGNLRVELPVLAVCLPRWKKRTKMNKRETGNRIGKECGTQPRPSQNAACGPPPIGITCDGPYDAVSHVKDPVARAVVV